MKDNNYNTEDIQHQFDEWKEKNKSQLPLNFDFWKTDFIQKDQQQVPAITSLGKYNSIKSKIYPFYKPISRIIQLTPEHEK